MTAPAALPRGRVWRRGLLLGLSLSLALAPAQALVGPASATSVQAAPASTTPSGQVGDTAQADDAVVLTIGPAGDRVTVRRSEFDRAFRLAVGELLGRQGLPLSADLLDEFQASRADFFEQFVRERKLEYLARHALPHFQPAGHPDVGPQSFASAQAYLDYLHGAGYTDEADYRREWARQALLNAYRDSVRRQFAFGDGVVAAVYAADRRGFVQRHEACVRHILTPNEAQARDLRSAILGGADFELLAHTRSRDPGSAARGGDLGCLAPGETVPPFNQAAFGGAVGALQVVETEFGWHLLTVYERHEGGPLSLEAAQERIRDTLAQEAAQRYIAGQLERLPAQTFAGRL